MSFEKQKLKKLLMESEEIFDNLDEQLENEILESDDLDVIELEMDEISEEDEILFENDELTDSDEIVENIEDALDELELDESDELEIVEEYESEMDEIVESDELEIVEEDELEVDEIVESDELEMDDDDELELDENDELEIVEEDEVEMDSIVEEDEVEETPESIDEQISQLEAKKESLLQMNDRNKQVLLSENRKVNKALKKLALKHVALTEAYKKIKTSLNEQVNKNSNLLLENAKLTSITKVILNSDLKLTTKKAIVENFDSKSNIKDVKRLEEKYVTKLKENNLGKKTNVSKKPNALSESVRLKKIAEAKMDYLMGLNDDYLDQENYMKGK